MRNRTFCHEPSTFKRSFAFPSRVREVYTSVERIHCSPLWSMARAANAGHCFLGLRASYMARGRGRSKAARRTRMVRAKQAGKGGAVSEPYHYHFC